MNTIWLLGGVLVLTLFLLPIFSKQPKLNVYFGSVAALLFFSIGAFNVSTHNSTNYNNYYYKSSETTKYQIRIIEPPVLKEKTIQLVVDVFARNDTTTMGKGLLYFEKTKKSKSIKYGDVIVFNGQFKSIIPNKNPLEFDYGRYLEMFDIHYRGYSKDGQWLKIGNTQNWLFAQTYGISEYLKELIDDSNLNVKVKGIAKALLIGQKEDLDRETLRTYSSAGAMHVLAVSGLHVGIVMYILMFVLKPLKRIRGGRKLVTIIVLLGVWVYAFITGLSPSVLRSSLMFSFIVIGNELERETNVYQSLIVSAFVLLLIDPLVIFKVGFQLSYLAVLGIVYLQPKIYNLIYIKLKPLDYLWKITAVSIAAQLATFPLGLYYFHQFPNLFFISNLIVIPLAGFILAAGIMYFVFHLVPILGELLLQLLNYLLLALNWSVKFVESLPYSISWGYSITWQQTLLIYFSLITAIFAFTTKKIKLVLISGVSIIVLLSILIIEKDEISKQNELIIYNIKDEMAVDIFYGRENVFIASDSLMQDDEKLLFHIRHYWFYKKGDEQVSKHVDINNLTQNILKVGQSSFSVLDVKVSKELRLTDYVVLGDVDYVSEYALDRWSSNKSVLIIHPSMEYRTRAYILKKYPKKLIFNIKTDGAFIFSF